MTITTTAVTKKRKIVAKKKKDATIHKEIVASAIFSETGAGNKKGSQIIDYLIHISRCLKHHLFISKHF